MTYIYFAKCNDHIKIGLARDVQKRLGNLRTSSASPIHLLASARGDVHVERQLHKHLLKFKVQGEWFRDCAEVREAMERFIESGEAADPVPRSKLAHRKFGAVAKLLWFKPAAAIAAIDDCNIRTAKRVLRGEAEVSTAVMLAACAEMLRRLD
jgi:hypothetical protein